MWWLNILIIILGYLIGSINPAYLLGRLKGIDIRTKGSKNAGATNAWHVLGKPYGIGIAFFDVIKGVLAFLLALWLTNSSFSNIPVIAYLAVFAAIIGHDFPFYLGKGGKGAATTYGILILNLALLLVLYKLPWQAVLSLFILTLCTFLIIKAPNITYFIFAPISAITLTYLVKFNMVVLFTYLFLLYIYIVSIINLIQEKGFGKELEHMNRKVKIKLFRKILRLFAVIFSVLYFFTNKTITLIVLGIILLFFGILDIVRKIKPTISKNKIIHVLFKKKEKEHVSTITLFLLSCFITIILFPKNIAIIAVLFLIFGDTIAELAGLKFGKFKLIGKKTLEGSLASLGICFLIGLILMNILNFSLAIIIIAAFAATIIELVPLKIKRFKIDDNFSVALFTSFVLWILSLFF